MAREKGAFYGEEEEFTGGERKHPRKRGFLLKAADKHVPHSVEIDSIKPISLGVSG